MKINKENIKNNRIVRHSYYYLRGITQGKKLLGKAQKALNLFGIEFATEADRQKQLKDMVRTNMLCGFDFDEYLYYHFASRSMAERRTFVADYEHLGYTCAMNDSKNAQVFDNKWMTFQKYKDFYRRDVAYCEGEAQRNQFSDFVQKHPSFIIKPLGLSCGHGVKIFTEATYTTQFYDDLLKENDGKFLAEELIKQTAETAKFHPSSVNTVRVPTIRLDNEVLIIHPFFRIGQHGNHVDNAGAGGIICVIDAQSGIINSAADEHGHAFEIHPDTGKKIIGYQIPRWDELVELVNRLAQILPENRYTGWDLALTDSGWLMVEANRRGQFVWQIATQVGFRQEINEILHKLGTAY